jgi:hypothetical protein
MGSDGELNRKRWRVIVNRKRWTRTNSRRIWAQNRRIKGNG